MKKNEFKNMHDYKSDVDASEIWAAIEPQVDALNEKRRKRRGIIFWWLGTGMFLLVVGGMYWGLTSDFEMQNSSSTIQITNTQDQVVTTKNQEPNLSNLIKTNGAENANTPSLVKVGKDEIANINIQQPNNNKGESNTEKETIINTEEITIIEPAAITTNEQEKAMKMVISSEKEGVTTIFPTIKKGTTFESMPQIPMIPFAYLNIENEQVYPVLVNKQQQVNVAKALEESKQTPPNDRNFTLSIGILGGVSFVNRNMESKHAEADALLQLRESTESVLEAHHYGLQLTATHRSGFELAFGVNQTTITERFDYLHTAIDTSTTYGLRYIYTDLEGETTNIYDSIPLIETMIMTKKIYNSHQLLEIPLTVGYSKTWKSWRVGAQVGVLVNVSLQTEGKIMNGVDVIIQIEAQNTPIYKTKIGLGYHFGLSLEREILPNINLSISPFVRAYSSDFTTENYGLSQKYMLFGGNVGLRYQFGK